MSVQVKKKNPRRLMLMILRSYGQMELASCTNTGGSSTPLQLVAGLGSSTNIAKKESQLWGGFDDRVIGFAVSLSFDCYPSFQLLIKTTNYPFLLIVGSIKCRVPHNVFDFL
jgi:hypothetical protein